MYAPTRLLAEDERYIETSDGQSLALVELSHKDAEPTKGRLVFLLLHGFAQNRRAFTTGRLPEELLRRGARVFVGELRGHGASHLAPGLPWTVEAHLSLDLPALIESIRLSTGTSEVHLVGHSMGGMLAYALLATRPDIASLLTFAAPIQIPDPLVRFASAVVGPVAGLSPNGSRVPMNTFLRLLAKPLSTPDARGPLGLLQRITRLSNPALAEPDKLEAVLGNADAESPAVCRSLAKMAVMKSSVLAGFDLAEAVRASLIPVAAVVGSRDIFAPRRALHALERPGQRGPRRIVEIEGGTHVDVAIGYDIDKIVAGLWGFLTNA